MKTEFIDLHSQLSAVRSEVDRAVARVLDHGRFVLGPEVDALEENLGSRVGAHCVTCANGTDALLISMMAIGVGRGDEVALPAFGYVAALEAILMLGATPRFVDIDPASYNIDPACLEKSVSRKTKAIVAMSLFGQCADIDICNQIAAGCNAIVIEDAAQSFGATYKGRQSGGLSSIATTSFFPSKPLGCYGDGGAIFIQDESMARLCRKIARHGQSSRYHHEVLGMNSRLDTIQAAILLEKLKIFDSEVVRKQQIAEKYTEEFELIDQGLITPQVSKENKSVWAQYTLRHIQRNEISRRLNEQGIPTAIHYPLPLTETPYLKKEKINSSPISALVSQEVFSLPMHPYLGPEKQDLIIASVKAVI